MSKSDPTIDDFFKATALLSSKMHEYMDSKNTEEKFASAMLKATDPDGQFKADIAMKVSTVLSMLDMFVTYMNKPVKTEGVLQRKMDGSVMLDDLPVPNGALVEYWNHDKWNLGKIAQNSQTKQPYISDPLTGKPAIDKIEQIKGRVR